MSTILALALPCSAQQSCAEVFAKSEDVFRRRDNKLRLNEPKQAEVDSFMKNPAWDGSITVPTNYGFQMEVKGKTVQFIALAIHEQSDDIRDLFKDIKHRSRADDPAREREFGAVLFSLIDGRSFVFKFTSNELQRISLEDHLAAFNGGLRSAGISLSQVSEVLHIHTHPAARYNVGRDKTIVVPSLGDYDFINYLQNNILRQYNPAGKVCGVVLPTCANCSDFFIFYRPDAKVN